MGDNSNFEGRLTKVETKVEELEKRQDNLDDLVITVKTLATREENVEADVKEIKTDVKDIISKPAKRWDTIIASIITAIVAGIIGYLLK